MMKLIKSVLISVNLWLITVFLYSTPADVTNISNRKYFPAVLDAIEKAEKSIYLCIYYISYVPMRKDKVYDLLNALIEAKKRGVDVEVILDRGKVFKGVREESKKNVRAFSYLRRHGISVFYDESEILTHAKFLIIDEKILITGSFNWSDNSLVKNREDGYIIRSDETVKEKVDEFKAIQRYKPAISGNTVPIPEEFVKDLDLASKMATKQDDNLFDFYLWIQKKSNEQKSREVQITNDDLYEFFFKHNSKKPYKKEDYVQCFMRAYLYRYKKEYSFLEDYKRDRNTKILTVTLDKENKTGDDSLYISEIYWKDGWFRRLSLRAKFCLFILLDLTDSGRQGGYVVISKETLSEKYNFGTATLSYGFTELQEFNLIERDINFRIQDEIPVSNGYMLNDFYIYSDFERDLEKFRKSTEKKMFKIIRKIVVLTHETHDLKSMRDLRSYGEEYGLSILKDTLKLIKDHEHSGVSPYRRLDYVFGVLKTKVKNEYEEEPDEQAA